MKNEQGFADGPASSFLTGHKVATAIYADTTDKLGRIAEILGDEEKRKSAGSWRKEYGRRSSGLI